MRGTDRAGGDAGRGTGSGRKVSGTARGGESKAQVRTGGDFDGSGDPFGRYLGVGSLRNPLWCYHGFIVAVLMLSVFGLIMVFSSSSVDLVAAGYSPWSKVINQAVFGVIGMIAAFALARIPVLGYRRLSVVMLGIAVLLQLLTFTPLGLSQYGNAGWISLGGFQMQPAEVTKFALCVWLPSALLDASRRSRSEGMRAWLPAGVVYAICLALVLLGKDLGTGMIVVFIGLTAFLVAGFPGRWMAAGIGVMAALVGLLVIMSPNRLGRVLAAYNGCDSGGALGLCYQSTHARYAIAGGGLLGVGLGNSHEKWNYLPAAHNDFIFAIIAEETGFVGAAIVILLFVVIGWCMISIALQTRDRYVSMVLVCITVWLVGQGLVNIGVVVGILPVLGVPMPFVSAGGSSLVMCLCAAGAAASMMRTQAQISMDVKPL